MLKVQFRVAELGSLSSGEKMAIKIFVKRVFTNLQSNSALLAQKTLFLTQKGIFLTKDLQKVRKLRQI